MILNYFTIFALLFASGEETNHTRICRAEMTISNALPVQLWIAECDTFNETIVDGINNRCWCQPWQSDDPITIQFQDVPGFVFVLNVVDESDAVLHSENFDEVSDGVYQASFIPSFEDIDDEIIQIKVLLNGSMVAKSDCLSVKTIQRESFLLRYSNHRDIGGLVFTSQSPDPSFYIRIPCRFAHEQFPQEDTAMELTSSVITTSSQVKEQRKLEVLHSPYYFHFKLIQILQCQTLEMDGWFWKKEEAYTIDEGNKRSILKSATCWLTKKNSVVRNVI
jgi:hypothetical protein